MEGGLCTVLVVDDDPALRSVCRVNLALDGHRVHEAGTLAAADAVLAREPVDVVLLDLRVGADDGRALLARIREASPDTAVVLLTGDVESAVEGADAILRKPFEIAALSALVRQVSGGGLEVG